MHDYGVWVKPILGQLEEEAEMLDVLGGPWQQVKFYTGHEAEIIGDL